MRAIGLPVMKSGIFMDNWQFYSAKMEEMACNCQKLCNFANCSGIRFPRV